MIYVVLGMHKSGTTLVSQILHHSGINMGQNVDSAASYDGGNKYERLSTRALNLEILGLEDIYTPSFDLQMRDGLQLSEGQRARMREIIQECNKSYTDWGFKDPRTCLIYPLWASELPEHKIIGTFRPPDEIWPRYRHKRLHHYHKNLSRACRFMTGWCQYNSNILAFLRNTSLDFVVLSYRELIVSGAEFSRLEEFVGTKLSDQRRQCLYRSRAKGHLLTSIATWWVHRQTGCRPSQIVEQFEALRNHNS